MTEQKEFKRIVGRFGVENGPLLLLVNGIHGNERAGYFGSERVFDYLHTAKPKMNGEVFGLTGNLNALKKGTRFIHQDLNRMWSQTTILNNEEKKENELASNEEKEQRIFLATLKNLIEENPERELIMVDFHTTSAKTGTFAIVNGANKSAEIALSLNVPVITNLNQVIQTTTLNFFEKLNFTAFAYEAGNHHDEDSTLRVEAAIWLIMSHLGMINESEIENFNNKTTILVNAGMDLKKQLVKFMYKHDITSEDEFKMNPGYENLQKVRKGEHLANDKNGKVLSPFEGRILMPLYQKKGSEGFFIIG